MSILTPPIGKIGNWTDVERALEQLRQDLFRMDTGEGEPFERVVARTKVMMISTLANDATPSVKGYSVWLTGGTTTITDFDDGEEGQVITVIADHTVKITHGTNIFLDGDVSFEMEANDTLTLIQKADGYWYELSRRDHYFSAV